MSRVCAAPSDVQRYAHYRSQGCTDYRSNRSKKSQAEIQKDARSVWNLPENAKAELLEIKSDGEKVAAQLARIGSGWLPSTREPASFVGQCTGRSTHFQRTSGLTRTAVAPTGRLISIKRALHYWLSPWELRARSYAQFIASHSSSAALKSQLADAIANPDIPGLPVHWDANDFVPIDQAMERLFRKKGWM